jgi:hypothetical protein
MLCAMLPNIDWLGIWKQSLLVVVGGGGVVAAAAAAAATAAAAAAADRGIPPSCTRRTADRKNIAASCGDFIVIRLLVFAITMRCDESVVANGPFLFCEVYQKGWVFSSFCVIWWWWWAAAARVLHVRAGGVENAFAKNKVTSFSYKQKTLMRVLKLFYGKRTSKSWQ